MTLFDSESRVDRELMIGIPVYNEERTIGAVIDKARQYGELVVINDGSTDGTAKILESKNINSLHFTENTGYGHALSLLFDLAHKNHYQYMITLDGDGQHNPEEIPTFLEALKDADVIVGNRFLSTSTDGLPLYRRLGIKILGMLLGIGDAQNGFRAYNQKAIALLTPREKGMGASIEILKLAKACALRIKEVPCSVTYTGVRHSKNPLIHGKELLKTLLWKF